MASQAAQKSTVSQPRQIKVLRPGPRSWHSDLLCSNGYILLPTVRPAAHRRSTYRPWLYYDISFICPSCLYISTYSYALRSPPSWRHSVSYLRVLWSKTDSRSYGRSWSDCGCRRQDIHPFPVPDVRSHRNMPATD